MLRWSLVVLLPPLPLFAPAAPIPPEDEAATIRRVYGSWNDADKDCKYTLTEGKLRIWLPEKQHAFSVGLKNELNNAPRLLHEIEGDFTAVVRVSYPIPKEDPKEGWPCWSGGLIAWESKTAFVTIGRSAMRGVDEPEVIREYTTNPEFLSRIVGFKKVTGVGYLRLKRVGNEVTPGYSPDGKKWHDISHEKVTWGTKLKVGVIAENWMNTPVEITFEEYSLTLPKK